MERLVELRHELVGAQDGAGDELGEEGGVEAEVEDVAHMGYLVLVDVDDVADVLEGVEGDAYGEQYLDGDAVFGAESGIKEVGEEVGILEEAEHEQVDDYTDYHQRFTLEVGGLRSEVGCGVFSLRLPTSDFRLRPVHIDAQEPSEEGGEDEQQDEEAGGLVVEEEADGEEVGVAGGEAPAAGDDEGEAGIDEQEEDPEVDLGEEQRVGAVETEELAEVCEEVGH